MYFQYPLPSRMIETGSADPNRSAEDALPSASVRCPTVSPCPLTASPNRDLWCIETAAGRCHAQSAGTRFARNAGPIARAAPGSACEPTARQSALARESRRKCSSSSSIRPCRARHRRCRVTSETRLKRAHDRLADACHGGLRRRRRTNSILDVVGPWIDGHLEEL